MVTHEASEQAHAPGDTELWRSEAQPTQPSPEDFERHVAELRRLVLATDWLMEVLRTSREVMDGQASTSAGTPWCVAAGAVRSVVWNHLHGLPIVAPFEIDLVHFSRHLAPAFDVQAAQGLARRLPQFRWDVVNQVYAHRLARDPAATPFASLEHAMACWPETATSVGVALTAQATVEVVAPFGLADLFGLVLRRSPLLRDPEVFEERAVAKRFSERWPRLRTI